MTFSSLSFLAFRRGLDNVARLALVLALSAASAAHAQAPQAQPALSKGEIAGRNAPCHSLSDCDRRDYDYSGTRGRMGLGADPAHPEGPGNAPN